MLISFDSAWSYEKRHQFTILVLSEYRFNQIIPSGLIFYFISVGFKHLTLKGLVLNIYQALWIDLFPTAFEIIPKGCNDYRK